ncbi:uncharacterized protein LOC141903845 isoform X2 [Tubulanus polymorphus]
MDIANRKLLEGQLLFVVESGDITAVERLINGGCSLNKPTPGTPLFYAVRANQIAMVEFLMSRYTTTIELPPISIIQHCVQYCIEFLRIEVIEKLLAGLGGEDLATRDFKNFDYEFTFEKEKPIAEYSRMFDLLSRYGVRVNIPSALKSAARERKTELVEKLLTRVDESFPFGDAEKMLRIACADVSIMQLVFGCQFLMEKFSLPALTEAFETAFTHGNKPAAHLLDSTCASAAGFESATMAAFLGDYHALEKILSTDDVTVATHPDLLHVAVRAGNTEIARLLIDFDWDVNTEVEFLFHQWGNTRTVTPLIVAANCGHLETVKFLLENGAEIEKGADHYASALYWATISGQVDIINLLLDAGADGGTGIAIVGLTALHQAIRKNLPIEIVKKLIDHGAHVNAHKAIGCIKGTPLGIALRNGYVEAVRVLLENDAITHTSESSILYNPIGEPLVIIARSYGESIHNSSVTIEMIELLYKFINIEQMPNTCMAALEQACESRNHALLRNMLTNFPLDVVEYWFLRNVSLRDRYRVVIDLDASKHCHSTLTLIHAVITTVSRRLPRIVSEFFLIYEDVILYWYASNPYSFTFLLQMFCGYSLQCYQLPESLITAIVKNSDFDNLYIMYSILIVTGLFNFYLNTVSDTDKEFIIRAKLLLSTPPKLLCLCRNVIRHQIIRYKGSLDLQNDDVKSLPIGLSLRNYLVFKM